MGLDSGAVYTYITMYYMIIIMYMLKSITFIMHVMVNIQCVSKGFSAEQGKHDEIDSVWSLCMWGVSAHGSLQN